jgi:hypothetical protein
MQRALFRSHNRFQIETLPPIATSTDVLLNDEQFRVRARPFDHHGLPSYAFAFEEHTHLNIWKNRLDTSLRRMRSEAQPKRLLQQMYPYPRERWCTVKPFSWR